MKSTGSKWLLGCGIGCGVILCIIVILGATGFFYLRETFRGLGEAEDSHDELVERLGAIEDYVPPMDGIIRPERLELFLSVREGLRESQRNIDSSLSELPFEKLEEGEPSFGEVMEVLGGLGSIISPLGEYVAFRNRALLDGQMGLGEYIYIYSIAYYSWLGHSPEDGPEIRAGERIFDGEDSTFGPRQVRQRYRRYMLALLRNQLDAISSPGSEEWRRMLEAEVRGFEANPGRIPWQEGLPPDIEFSLEPLKSRFEVTYHRTTNCLEFPPRDEENWHFSDRE